MVVVSGSWVKNVASYPSPTMSNGNTNDMVIPLSNNNHNNNQNNNMFAKAVLICRPNSHPFQERTLTLDQPVKVGRSVARGRPTPTNAIFDCKVLSRHHAVLWYDCGKFYLQDTKSSNGTFVNNNRLSSNESDAHEVSSGDIVQFGVDVLENKGKVTHGCIIATLKLYLPDGKEAKASPSITEANRHGLVPLDELYKLNQIIQEASQREQCLETKLTALQQVVEKAKKSADESWQTYIGEERLLSRVAALESQLTQVGKNWNDEKLREEIVKLQEDSIAYQMAAKTALDRLYAEKLEAVAALTEEQRAKLAIEQESILTREQLFIAQKELQEIAQKLSEEQRRADETKAKLEQREKELLEKLDADTQTINSLEEKINTVSNKSSDESLPLEALDKFSLTYDLEMKSKEDLLGENEMESNLNRTNEEPKQNIINIRVVPVVEHPEVISVSSGTMVSDTESVDSDFTITLQNRSETQLEANFSQDTLSEETANNILKDHQYCSTQEHAEQAEECQKEKHEDEVDETEDHIDSKTLKYRYQSEQMEMKKQIERLESVLDINRDKILELENEVKEQKQLNKKKSEESDSLKEELLLLQQKFKETSNEAQQLKDKLCNLKEELENAESKMMSDNNISNMNHNQNISKNFISAEQFAALEEELVVVKEKYVQLNEEKVSLNKALNAIKEEYNVMCNRNYNQLFMYIAPLVLMVLYLLISSMFS